jgi:hypothetical protein
MSDENNTLYMQCREALLEEALGDANPGQLQALAQQLQISRVASESREPYIAAYREVARARRVLNRIKAKYNLFDRQCPWIKEADAAVELDIVEEQK